LVVACTFEKIKLVYLFLSMFVEKIYKVSQKYWGVQACTGF